MLGGSAFGERVEWRAVLLGVLVGRYNNNYKSRSCSVLKSTHCWADCTHFKDQAQTCRKAQWVFSARPCSVHGVRTNAVLVLRGVPTLNHLKCPQGHMVNTPNGWRECRASALPSFSLACIVGLDMWEGRDSSRQAPQLVGQGHGECLWELPRSQCNSTVSLTLDCA